MCRNNKNIGRSSAVFISIALVGCGSHTAYDRPPSIHSLQEAASVNVTTMAVAPWGDYVSALQTQFALSSSDALNLAVPQTSISQSSFAENFGLGLQVGLPQSTRTQTQTNTNNQSSSNTSTNAVNQGVPDNSNSSTNSAGNAAQNSTTVNKGPGTAPASALPAQVAPSTGGIAGPAGTLQTDPILSYTAAAAIYQEVLLLNRYLADGAQRYGYIPYLVRMQVSVMPFARNEPYDVYVDIGLFSKCKTRAGRDDLIPAVVVPLLITDDVEKGQGTTAENIARQLALSVSGVANNAALGGNVGELTNRFNAVLASKFNSLFMVSRSSDNVLEVRMGAATSPNIKKGYAALAQTHNVTFVVLVRHDHAAIIQKLEGCDPDADRGSVPLAGFQPGPQLQVTSVARMRDVATGKELPPDTNLISKRARDIYHRFTGSAVESVSDKYIKTLTLDVQTNDYSNFQSHLKPDVRDYAESLWTALSTVSIMSEYSSTAFNLPYPSILAADLELQTLIVQDNCKDTATVTVMGFTSTSPAQYLANLNFQDGGYSVAAAAVSQTAPGAPLTITFPSFNELPRDLPEIKSVCSAPAGTVAAPRRLEGAALVLRQVIDSKWRSAAAIKSDDTTECPQDKCKFKFKDIVFDGSPQFAQSVVLTAGADSVVADPKGNGAVRLLVKLSKDLDGVSLTFSGGVLSSTPTVSGVAVNAVNGGLTVVPAAAASSSTAGPVVLDLVVQGLVTGRAFVVSAVGQKSQKPVPAASAVVVVPVVAPPAAAKAAAATS